MLLYFKFRNYKSFYDEAIFSMTPAPKQKDLEYSIQTEKVGNHQYKGLCSSVIYGPNASGKTNVIGAMDTLRAIFVRGNINNSFAFSPNIASSSLELIPNCNNKQIYTEFSVGFIHESMLFEYTLKIDLGKFLDGEYDRKIKEESLYVNNKKVFLRNETLEVNLPLLIKPYINESIKRKSKKMLNLAQNSLNDRDLFLVNGFKMIYANKLVSRINEWFFDCFLVVYRSDVLIANEKISDPNKDKFYIQQTLTDSGRIFGMDSEAVGIKVSENGKPMKYSLLKDKKTAIPSEVFESFGTIRFLNIFPLVLDVFNNGGTLVVDEFDASIHPMAIMNLISIFHNDELNKNHAQLIFNTHNPIFLNASLFRRDEIKFVERNAKGDSELYSLSDFRTADGVRKGEDYMNNYFVNCYGAINEVDFTPVFEQSKGRKGG